MLERDFQTAVVELAHFGSWLVHHTRTVHIAGGGWTSPGIDRGFPDLVLVKPPHIIYVELKTDVGRLSTHQFYWLEMLKDAGADVRVWRPRDWPEIQNTLAPSRKQIRNARSRPV